MKFQFSSSSKPVSSAKATNAETAMANTQDTKSTNEFSPFASYDTFVNARGRSILSSNDNIITQSDDAQIGLRGGDGIATSSAYCNVM